jgi:UrcA family protein
MFRLLKVSVAAVALAAFAQGAYAQPNSGYDVTAEQVSVNYGDLNIGNEGDAQVMLDRIDHAAIHACGSAPSSYPNFDVAPGYARQDFEACRTAAVSKTVAALGAPVLSRVYADAHPAANTRLANN